MKLLSTTLLVLLLGTIALAQPGPDRMGASAYTDLEEEFIFIESGVPFEFYLCVFEPSRDTIGGYECGLEFLTPDLPIILDVDGPNGWTNFGDTTNHLVGFQTPVPASPITVICTYQCLVTAEYYENQLIMGASDPSSFDGAGPGYADGVNPDVLVLCSVPAGGSVATISTEILATEARSLSGLKALFD
ncbi:hypothetical protein GF314_09190 [bacterium]|nr:hypothetical protein [bacterium]